MSERAILIEVSGKVQGVFFRASTKEVCDRLGIAGWVKNVPSGNVMIHAQGSAEQLSALQDWCKQGSQLSKVGRINVGEATEMPHKGFEIRQ
jgi:acylphosphatase